jgi:hypothetical protein
METQRVDIDFDKETLRWAGIEAAKLGISRRRFIKLIVKRLWDMIQQSPSMAVKEVIRHIDSTTT